MGLGILSMNCEDSTISGSQCIQTGIIPVPIMAMKNLGFQQFQANSAVALAKCKAPVLFHLRIFGQSQMLDDQSGKSHNYVLDVLHNKQQNQSHSICSEDWFIRYIQKAHNLPQLELLPLHHDQVYQRGGKEPTISYLQLLSLEHIQQLQEFSFVVI